MFTQIYLSLREEIWVFAQLHLQLSPENDSTQIYDVTEMTRKLDWGEIRQLKFNFFNPNVNLANEDIKSFDEDIDSIQERMATNY